MITADDIERAKAVPIATVVEHLKLKRHGRELVGPCPVCGGTDRFGVHITKGIFNCRGCEATGDVIQLVRLIDGCSFAEAVERLAGELRRRGLLDQRSANTRRKPTAAPRADDGYEREQQAKAGWLWQRRQPIIDNTPPSLYLRKRGYDGPIPATLGYLLPPTTKHPPATIAAFGLARESEPGIIAPPADVRAVHITRLAMDGNKASVEAVKITLGPGVNLPIVLAPANDLLGLAVTEGIEDGLSVYAATGLGVWAAGSAGRMPALAAVVPDWIDCITIYAHDDPAGQRDAKASADRLLERGFPEVLIEGLA